VAAASQLPQFLDRFGRLVAVADDGTLVPAMWPAELESGLYGAAVRRLHAAVQRARITAVFVPSERVCGQPETGVWRHLAVHLDAERVQQAAGVTASHLAERRTTVERALQELKPAALDEALRVLKADVLYRADRFVAPVQWLRDVHDLPPGPRGANLLWRAIATAPQGYCHPRASMVTNLYTCAEFCVTSVNDPKCSV
jgi:hypothetical protein